MTTKEFAKILQDKLTSEYGVDLSVASKQQIYRSLALICRQMMSENHKKFQSKAIGTGTKQVYYLCMEFLMGRSLKVSLFNLGLEDVAQKVLADADINIEGIFEEEPDAGLGNGGLGRLAACYLDGMATTGICGTGYSILYEYGIFKQKIVDGWQQERADNWLPGGQVWLKSHPDQAIEVRFDGEIRENWDHGFHYIQHTNYNSVMAVPSDMYVQGYDGKGVAKLRLWQAKAPDFDMSSFSLGNYNTAMSKNASAELISKVLYPNDNHIEGKILRLRQQYFLSAASIGDIVQNHLSTYGTLENLADKVAIQLNDTHPTLAIPEMMRILLDECGFDWDKAFEICQKVFAYTNHTVMAEALEKWNVDIFKMTLPRIYQIVVEMNRRAREELEKAFPGDEGKINYMALIGDNQVRMANICAYTANSINGVSKLHSEIIKDSVFHDYYLFKPQAFKNVTNGIDHRRWLSECNPKLDSLIRDCLGGDGYLLNPDDLSGHIFWSMYNIPYHLSDFFRSTISAGWNFFFKSLSLFAGKLIIHRGIDYSAGNRINLNVTRCEFFGERFGKSVDAGLGSRVCNFTGSTGCPPHGRNIDDFSGTFGNHRRNRLSATVKYGRKISLNDPVPVLICHISQKINIGNTCIVDEYIKMCTFLINFIVNCPYVVRISYITRYKCTWSMVFFGDICPELFELIYRRRAIQKCMISAGSE